MARIFISYARKYEPFARKIATSLSDVGANVWLDVKDIPLGMNWSSAIQEGLDLGDLMILILTPEAMVSENVAHEWQYYLDDGKPIIPILLVPTRVHFQIRRLQYVDFHGQDYETAFAQLHSQLRRQGLKLNALSADDANITLPDNPTLPVQKTDTQPPIPTDELIDKFYNRKVGSTLTLAKEADKLLTQISQRDDIPFFLDLEIERADMNAILEKYRIEQQKAKERARLQREYNSLEIAIKHQPFDRARRHVEKWLDDHPNFPDSKNYRDKVSPIQRTRKSLRKILPVPFDLIHIPAGQVTLTNTWDDEENYVGKKGASKTFDVVEFAIAKYPVTNAQFEPFLKAGGYDNQQWWTTDGWKQRQKDGWTQPRYWDDAKWNNSEQPIVGVSWYEAVAYCHWLSETTSIKIMLLTEQQWQRAAQGDYNRTYPWGDEWHCERCNNSVRSCDSNITTFVTHYESKGDSPFGVVDMVGNVWEWCLTDYYKGGNDMNGTNVRCLRGGSWLNDYYEDFRCVSRLRGNPSNGGNYRGFRFALSY